MLSDSLYNCGGTFLALPTSLNPFKIILKVADGLAMKIHLSYDSSAPSRDPSGKRAARLCPIKVHEISKPSPSQVVDQEQPIYNKRCREGDAEAGTLGRALQGIGIYIHPRKALASLARTDIAYLLFHVLPVDVNPNTPVDSRCPVTHVPTISRSPTFHSGSHRRRLIPPQQSPRGSEMM